MGSTHERGQIRPFVYGRVNLVTQNANANANANENANAASQVRRGSVPPQTVMNTATNVNTFSTTLMQSCGVMGSATVVSSDRHRPRRDVE
jgi:hypothetical protein